MNAANALPRVLTAWKFEIAVRRMADDLRYGLDASAYIGPGVDFLQSRPFVDGDPVRDIDWRVTARTGRLHVKQYETIKTTPMYLVVDTSASMAFRSSRVSKHLLALLVAGGLGLSALQRLSPVGVLAAGEREAHAAPNLSRSRLYHALDRLRHCRFDESTQLAARLGLLRGLLTSRNLVVVISDLQDEGCLDELKRLAVRHDTIALQVQDPAEQGSLRGGILRCVEAESGRQFVAHATSRWFREDDRRPGEVLKSAGIDHLVLRTDLPVVGPLRRMLAARGGLLRNVR